MKDEDRTKEELINELEQLRQRVAQLEHSEAELKQVEKALEVGRRERIEKVLEHSEQGLRSIVESVPDIIYELDSNRKITFINKAVERLLGHSQKELVGKDILELVHPDDREKARYRMAERRRSGILARPEEGEKSRCTVVERRTRADTDLLEVRLVKRDKVPVHVLITSAEGVYKEGKFIGTLGSVGIAKDITERKRAEEELEKMANELERSNKELELFAYIVSHDLQEPLRKVQAFGDKLKIRYAQVLDDQGLDYLERITKATTRMKNMINDLLAFSRVTIQAKSLTAIDLNQIVNNVVSDLQLLIEQSGGSIEIGELPTVDSNSTQMYQLMSNLIKNALKFRKYGIAPLVKTYSKLIGNQCQIFVEDNGIGFDEKYSERIFQLFQRLHGRGEYEGTGLGLAICQKIAKCHGGDISARSEPGKGATFIVTLPVNHPKG